MLSIQAPFYTFFEELKQCSIHLTIIYSSILGRLNMPLERVTQVSQSRQMSKITQCRVTDMCVVAII